MKSNTTFRLSPNAMFGHAPSFVLADEYSKFPDSNKLLKRSYEHGYPCALYAHGKNIRKDRPEEALQDFKAAKQLVVHFVNLGDEDAMRCAAEMYERGDGLACDLERAKKLRDELKRREEEKSIRRRDRANELYRNALKLLDDLNERIVVDDKDEYGQYQESIVLQLEKSTLLGNPYAEWKLGILIKDMNASLSEKYCAEAKKALKALSESGDIEAAKFIKNI